MGRLVAVRALKVAFYGSSKAAKVNDILSIAWGTVSTVLLQTFCKGAVLWSTLSHPNVLKLVGVLGNTEEGQFTISEWMQHGNIVKYIKNNHVNRLDLVRDFAPPHFLH